MKSFFLLLFITLTAYTSNGQNISKDSLLKKMSAEVCAKIKASDSVLRKADDFELQLGLLMIPVMSSYKEELEKVIPGFVFGDQIETLSEELGMDMAMNCPAFLKLVSSNPAFLEETNLNPERTIEGKLVLIQEADFTNIQVKLSNGRTEKLWWLEYFEGADGLVSKALLSKNVTVRYIEKEVYSAALKDYIVIKVIIGITKK
jgi:hypothetical protein